MEQKKKEGKQYQPIPLFPSLYFKQYNIPEYYAYKWNRIWSILFILGLIAYCL